MYKVTISKVDGRYAYDINGNRLRIISNLQVYPGCKVFTDGLVIYGYHNTMSGGSQAPSVPVTIPLYHWDYDDNATLYRDKLYMDTLYYWTKTLTDVRGGYGMAVKGVFPPNVGPLWPGRPPFFNSRRHLYSLRGSWENPVLYTFKGDEPVNVPGKRLFLANDEHENFFWQTGDYCETALEITGRTFPWIEYAGSNTYVKNIHNFSGQAYTYSLKSSGLRDLSLVFGDTLISEHTVDICGIVDDILAGIAGEIKTLQDNSIPAGEPTTPYYEAPPDPYLLAFGLCSWKENEVLGVYPAESDALNDSPPCDSDSAKGGCPLYNVSTAFGDTAGVNFRVIRRPHLLDDGSVQFRLGVRGCYAWFPYVETMNPGTYYNPPSPAGGSYLWEPRWMRYVGEWLITVPYDGRQYGAPVLTEIFRSFWSEMPSGGADSHHLFDTIYNSFTEQYVGGYEVNYVPDPDNDFVYTCTFVRKFPDDVTITIPLQFTGSRDSYHVETMPMRWLFQYDGKTVILVSENSIEEYSYHDMFVVKTTSTGATILAHGNITGKPWDSRWGEYNDSIVVNTNIFGMKRFAKKLSAVPYIELET